MEKQKNLEIEKRNPEEFEKLKSEKSRKNFWEIRRIKAGKYKNKGESKIQINPKNLKNKQFGKYGFRRNLENL